MADMTDTYCRGIESYLCQKNDGHLIRIAGPTFERVCDWAARGIPLSVVFHGIDRYFERYYAKGPRRRPVRIDFCEADILDVFDEWRRAVGVHSTLRQPQGRPERSRGTTGSGQAFPETAKSTAPRGSLAAHIDRIVGRLVARRSDPATAPLDDEISRVLEHLDEIRALASKARGAARVRLITSLAELDRGLSAAARSSCSPDLWAALTREASADLEPFRERMAAAVYDRALELAVNRFVRQRFQLPNIAYE